MTKLLNILIVLLAAALVFVILYPQIQQNRPLPVRFACDSSAASLPVLVAMDEGLFTQNKIQPQLVFYSDPDKALDDLFAGKVDAGVFPWSTVLKRIADKGDTLKVMMSEDYRTSLPVDGIFVPAKSSIRTTADLRGKRFGYPAQVRDYVPLFLANVGLAPTDLKLSEVPFGELSTQLAAGTLDAVWLIEPLICPLDTIAYRAIQMGALARYVSQPFPGAAFGLSSTFIKSKRVAGGRVKIATDAAVSFIETKLDRAKLILAKHFPYCTDVCGACRIPEVQRLQEINKLAVAALTSRMRQSGALSKDIDTKGIFIEPATLTVH
jgi:ABC-type nitrate/sulfonate/bicarbonate transport system substrate-binding protein